MRSRVVDVSIVGAGPAGAALALRLARSGISVVLIEASDFGQFRAGESLAPSVAPLLKGLNLWDRFSKLEPVPSFGTRSLWGYPTLQSHSHIQNPHGCGWHIERAKFDAMLAHAAEEAGARLLCSTKVTQLRYLGSSDWALHVTDHAGATSCFTTRVLVDATGRGAHLARRLSGERILLDHLIALVTRYTSPYLMSHRENHILLETCPQGWWYSAPVDSRELVAMLMTDSDLSGQYGQAATTAWQGLLGQTQVIHPRLEKHRMRSLATKPIAISAVSQRLDRHADHRPWIAVGDAALATDPISGSGVVRALRDSEHAEICVRDILGGNVRTAVAGYEADLDQLCTEYLNERAGYYAIERRWSENTFWGRRLGALQNRKVTC